MTLDPAKRNAALVAFADAASYMGDLFYLIAINAWVARASGRPELLGMIAGAGSFALALGNPIGGLLADRFDKRRLLVATDLLSALIALATYFIYTQATVPAAPLIGVNILLALCFSVYSPTARSIGPLLASGEGLRKLNALLSVSGEITRIAAPALGAVLLASSVLGERGLILMNAASFLVSAAANFALRPRAVEQPPKPIDWRILRGYREVWSRLGRARLLLLPIGLVNLFSGGLAVLFPFLGRAIGPTHYPNLLLAQGVGAVVGATLAGKLAKVKSPERLMLFLALAAAPLAGLHPEVPAYVHYVLLFAFGAFIAMFNVNFYTVVQTEVPPAILGRTFGLIMTAAAGLVPIGNIGFGWLATRLPDASIPLAGIGMLASVSALGLAMRAKEPRAPIPAPAAGG